MQKRTSWDQKNKYIHKSRKKIIDTVFGREDNTQRVFGYEGEGDKKREVGEVWTDSEGKTWEQKEYGKIRITDDTFAEARAYLDQLNSCKAEDCKTIKLGRADKKIGRAHV